MGKIKRQQWYRTKNSSNLISHTDLLRSYLGLLCLGKSDYEDITSMRENDYYFKNSLRISYAPSSERPHQRLDEEAEKYLPIIQKCSVSILKKGKANITALGASHIPLDANVCPNVQLR